MTLKILRYTVTADSVVPNYERRAGVQFDHKKTALHFDLDNGFYNEVISLLLDGSVSYRFDCYDGEGKCHVGVRNELLSPVLKPYELEYWVTRFGGKLKVVLVITITEGDVTKHEWSYEILLSLDDLPESDIDEKQYKSMSTLSSITENSEKKAREHSEKIAQIYASLKEIEELLKNGEWIFDGSVGSEVDVRFIVDNALNENSENALSNKVITQQIFDIKESIKQLNDTVTEKVQESLINKVRDEVVDLVYPIGSYYWSNNSTNPSILFGGAWEKIENVFVLAAGDKYSCGTRGGEAEHLLTQKEMPGHAHGFVPNAKGWDGANFVVPTDTNGSGVSSISVQGSAHSPGHWATDTWGTDIRGGSQAHNNMPPFIAAYCWRRIEEV